MESDTQQEEMKQPLVPKLPNNFSPLEAQMDMDLEEDDIKDKKKEPAARVSISFDDSAIKPADIASLSPVKKDFKINEMKGEISSERKDPKKKVEWGNSSSIADMSGFESSTFS